MKKIRVVAFNGSARKDGNTAILINHVLKELQNEGIETELIQFAGKHLKGCTACMRCSINRDMKCVIKNDPVNGYIKKMIDADGIILGSPTYMSDITANMKAFIERAGIVARANDEPFRYKVGAAVVSVRRGGAIHTFDTLNHFFLIRQMIVPGSLYWNIAIGREIGEVEHDDEGIKTMSTLGKNMAWLLKKL
ncbi:MAG: flavodoxin family protein [Syntrophorhabdaceae bacterium]|nr:flavodoxin family protein [Syntrophorhabdaceae bacterium]